MFEDRTAEAIREELVSYLREKKGFSVVPGGYNDTVCGRVATELAKCYSSLNAALSILFVDEASEGFLDLNGEDYYNLPRRDGTRARAEITFAGTPGMSIPAGTAFLTAGGLEFALLEPVELDEQGAGTGALEAAEVGAAYNVKAEALTEMYVNLPGLDEWHSGAGRGGSDREDGASYFARIDERRKRPPTSGNIYHYRQWAMEVSGVGAVKVIPLQSGPGTVGVLVVDREMLPAGSGVVSAVAENVERQRPIGAAVHVAAPEAVTVPVSAAVELAPGASPEAVRAELEEKLRAYFRSAVGEKYGRIYAGPEEDLPYRLLYNRAAAILMDVAGVENYTALTLAGTESDVELQPGQVPELGEVQMNVS